MRGVNIPASWRRPTTRSAGAAGELVRRRSPPQAGVVVLTSGSAVAVRSPRRCVGPSRGVDGGEGPARRSRRRSPVNTPPAAAVTFYRDVDQLPPFTDYGDEGRTSGTSRRAPVPVRIPPQLPTFRLGLRAKRNGSGAEIRATVRTRRPGWRRVVQLYVGAVLRRMHPSEPCAASSASHSGGREPRSHFTLGPTTCRSPRGGQLGGGQPLARLRT